MGRIFYLLPLVLFEFSIRAQNITVTGNTYFAVPSGANVAVPGDITINSTGAFSNSGTVSLTGNWTNNGTINAGDGLYILNGTSNQTLDGNTLFDTLRLNNSAGAILASGAGVNIFTALQLENGTFDISSGRMTLLSTAVNQCAIIDNFSPGNSGSITGNIIAQRYYGPASAFNDFGQHMLGSPVGSITTSSLGSVNASSAYYEAETGGNHNCNELVGETGTPYGKVFSYDESHASSCVQNGWLVEASSNPVPAGKGYSVVLGVDSGILSLTGPPNLNTAYSVTTTNSGYPNTTSDQHRVYTSGINLLSNPYPASLAVSSLAADNGANFNSTIYVWNESTGSYYTPSTVAPFQAFKVIRTGAGSGNYIINGSSRTISTGTFQRTINPMELNITVTNNNTGLTDETTVGFNPNSTAQFNPAYDLIKLPGSISRHTLYTLNSNDWMWVNVINSISETSTVPVGFEPGVSGTYTANFSGLTSFDPTSYITLEDIELGIMHDVRSGDYTFTSNANDNFNRFALHFTPPASISTIDATCSGQGMINIIQPGTAIWNYTLTDNNNITLSSGTLNINSPVSASTPAGVYILTLKDNNGYTVIKAIRVNGEEPVVASFSISANSVNVNQAVSFSSTSGVTLNDWNFGDGTTGNGVIVSHSYDMEGIYHVTLTSANISGCLSLTSNDIIVTRSATAVNDLNKINNILVWSNQGTVFVDFGHLNEVQASVEIYNILGQRLSEDKYVTSTIYHKQIPDIEDGYIVVRVKNDDEIITKKLLINGIK